MVESYSRGIEEYRSAGLLERAAQLPAVALRAVLSALWTVICSVTGIFYLPEGVPPAATFGAVVLAVPGLLCLGELAFGFGIPSYDDN